jgi:hypothetical protein
MTKTLTIHNKSRGGEHWFLANAYGKEEIKAIKDPEGGNTKKLPTSIPSPFSQFDLVKTAFRNVVEAGFDNCSPLDFRIVSHTLDVGQLFFNLKAFENNLSITSWDSKADLQNLLTGSKKHSRFGAVLKLFLDQDAETYNFDKLNKLFILKFNHGIVGGTSPATVFFASPNNLDFAQLTMPNNDILFDDSYCHLYDRDEDYQLFWFALQKAMPEFGSRFREVNDYLEMVKEYWAKKDRNGFYDKIKKLDFNVYANEYEIGNSGVGGFDLEILGFPLRISKEGSETNKDSDFEINSTKYHAEKMPLVLVPKHSGRNNQGSPMNYWGGDLSDNIASMIPYKYEDATAVTERRLPGVSGANYPCLLANDFLEPYLIRLVYPINEKCFFDGNLSNRKEEKDFLIPIKKEFFEYFNIEDLRTRSMPDGSPMYSMRAIIGDSVEVTLRVPIKNNEYITFQRIYYDGIIPEPFDNKGGIIEHQFGLNIFPFVKHDAAIQADYRVMLLDRDIDNLTSRYHLTFLNGDSQKVEYKTERHKRKKSMGLSGSHFYILKEQFDVIEVSLSDSNIHELNKRKGLVIPLFSEKTSNKKFRFAIDFGTTNTHIEYTVDGGVPKPFEITENDVQIATLHNLAFAKKDPSLNGSGATDVVSFIDKEFVPVIIEKGKMASFPQRTILAESHDISYGSDTYVIGDFNIPFPYEKEPLNEYKISANLKWQNYQMDEHAKRRVEAFFEKLLFMIKAKILLNQGNLKDTEIIWTYPSSMTSGRLENLKELWEKSIEKYIGTENHLKISESIAPYYYYKTKNIYAGAKPAVNIDIGGGTTDIVVFVNDKPKLLTSFKFAANSIFGDGFGDGGSDNNGFINRYSSKIKSLLAENSLYNLIQVYNQLEQSKSSVDLAAFFFSIEENPEVLEKGLPISYPSILKRDDSMRFVFLVFYGAILYHTTKLLKKEGIAMPRYITLSGKGSKVLDILGSTQRITKLSEVIIKKIYDEKDENGGVKYAADGLNIITEAKTPKEVTCKGALQMDKVELKNMDDIYFIKTIKKVWSGVKDGGEVKEPEVYSDINNEVIKGVKAEIEDFIDFLFSLHRDFNFQDELNISVSKLQVYKDLLKKDIENHIEQGLNIRKKELQGDFERRIEETLFFYHFVPALNKLAIAIHQGNPL